MTDEIPPEAMDKIIGLIYSNQKIEAVKQYKELRGTSLLESKQFIEQLTEQLKEESPENFQQGSGATGCAGMLVLAAATLASIMFFPLLEERSGGDARETAFPSPWERSGADARERAFSLSLGEVGR